MILFPAIDIRNGKCVRLIQGDYNQEKIYSEDPVDMALQWEKQQATFIHIVDLDGAKTGESSNKNFIKEIAQQTGIPIQVGGGIRSLQIIEEYTAAGVDRVIIGTAAINDPLFLREAIEKYGEKIAVSIDARGGYVATDGWTETSTVKAIDLIKELEAMGVQTVIYTDILKDGMLQGPNLSELQAINEATSINVIASGGVSSLKDIEALKKLNLYGTIIGKALYDGTLLFDKLMEANTMSMKRIIPCLDVDKGRVVKGKKFQNIQDVADPVAFARKYNLAGADELVFYDITASIENRGLFLDLIEKVAAETTIPFTVGGGIRTLDDIQNVLNAGADKVSINSAAIENPQFIKEAALKFGTKSIVFAMDVKRTRDNQWQVFKNGGQTNTSIDAIEWAKQGEQLGAGEIVANVIDTDGERTGYDVALTKAIAESVNIPVVASGGAGEMKHFSTVLQEGKADSALAASVFHYDEIQIDDLKNYLDSKGINVRREL